MNRRHSYPLKALLLTGAVLLLVLAVVTPELLFTPRAYLEMQRCASVKLGMSEQQVLAIVGPPQSRKVKPDGSIELTYREPLRASAAPVTYLAPRNGKYVVTGPICADLG